MAKTPSKKTPDFLFDTLVGYAGGMLFIEHIRKYVKNFPSMKPKVIEALEALLQELKNSK